MARGESWLEYTTAQDAFFNYCLWEYRPHGSWENKLRSVNLLRHSFAVAGLDERSWSLVPAIRSVFGLGRTVWGIKHSRAGLSWEFYCYDYRRRERTRSITRLLPSLQPYLPCALVADEGLPYFMFSFDVPEQVLAGAGRLDQLHLYFGNPGSTVSSGLSYALTGRGLQFENLYSFFAADEEGDQIVGKVACSAFVDTNQMSVERVLWPELRPCRVIVVANKRHCDGVYFSGLSLSQLLGFLQRLNYPAAHVEFIFEHRALLDHLQFDVGFDYRLEGADLRILKSAYYGFF